MSWGNSGYSVFGRDSNRAPPEHKLGVLLLDWANLLAVFEVETLLKWSRMMMTAKFCIGNQGEQRKRENWSILTMDIAWCSSETSVIYQATWCGMPERKQITEAYWRILGILRAYDVMVILAETPTFANCCAVILQVAMPLGFTIRPHTCSCFHFLRYS